jgi:ribose transport system ATP-binding protein
MAGITVVFPGVKALDLAALTVRPGEVHGLVGENGAGKSTMIKVLAGVYAPDEGTVSLDGERQVTLLPNAIHAAGVRFIIKSYILCRISPWPRVYSWVRKSQVVLGWTPTQ